MDNLAVRIADLELRNPVMPASGCFGPELGQLIDLNRLGALVTKTVFCEARAGNPAPRVTDSGSVMLNSVGIPSPGIERFLDEVLPRYQQWAPPTIVSIGGLAPNDYLTAADRLRDVGGIGALEVNVSCPNLEAGGLEIGADPHAVEGIIRGVRDRSTVPVIAKLTPNVTSIVDIAIAAEAGGADAIAAINTVVGMGINVGARRTTLGMGGGGMSGTAIKPIALHRVWSIARAVRVPVIGIGGIRTAWDVLEFMAAGAVAVQFGTVNFSVPDAMIRALEDLEAAINDHRNSAVGPIGWRLDG